MKKHIVWLTFICQPKIVCKCKQSYWQVAIATHIFLENGHNCPHSNIYYLAISSTPIFFFKISGLKQICINFHSKNYLAAKYVCLSFYYLILNLKKVQRARVLATIFLPKIQLNLKVLNNSSNVCLRNKRQTGMNIRTCIHSHTSKHANHYH